MPYKRRSIFTLIFYIGIIGLFLFMSATQKVYACEPTATPDEAGLPPTEIPQEIVAAQKSLLAQVIVEGKVLDFKTNGPDGTVLHDVVFEVSQYDKGSGPQRILLAGSFSLFCPMVPPFAKDDQLILLLSSQPMDTGTASVIEWYNTYDAQIITSIRKAAGEKPHAPNATPVGQLPYTPQSTSSDWAEMQKLWIIIAASIFILIFIILLWLEIRRWMKQVLSK